MMTDQHALTSVQRQFVRKLRPLLLNESRRLIACNEEQWKAQVAGDEHAVMREWKVSAVRMFDLSVPKLFRDLVSLGGPDREIALHWAADQLEVTLGEMRSQLGDDEVDGLLWEIFREECIARREELLDSVRVKFLRKAAMPSSLTARKTPTLTTHASVTRKGLPSAIENILRKLPPDPPAVRVADLLDEERGDIKDLLNAWDTQLRAPSCSWIFNGHNKEAKKKFQKLVSRIKTRLQARSIIP
jgi:hypothetical protein